MLTAMLLTIFCEGNAHFLQQDSIVTDSVSSKKNVLHILRFTTRLHSSGFFNFSGRICSPTPAIDMNVLYERSGFGASLFTARDLYDKNSDNNFAFGILYKRLTLSKRLVITPNIGVVMENFGESFGERLFVVTTLKASPKLTIDETSFFSNVLNTRYEKEWINRVRFIYTQTSQLQFILSNWHNNAVLDNTGYISGAFQAQYGRIRITNHAHAQASIAFFVMALNTEEVPRQEKSGLLFTFAFIAD